MSKKALEILRILENNYCKKIIEYVRNNPNVCVKEIYIKVRLSDHSTTSFYVGKLHKLGILNKERNGKYVLHTINEEKINKITLLTKKLEKLCLKES